MKYFYLHPFKPQYFFPKTFKKHETFCSFFQPYSLGGKISWWLFRNFGWYRIWFGKINIEDFIPELEIRQIVGLNPIMAFNTGTQGPEQKITALGWDNNNYFFVKYAQTPLAIKNVINEYKNLQQLSQFDFVPQIQHFYHDKQRVLLQTDVLTGNRFETISLNQNILNCLFKLAEIPISSDHKFFEQLEITFAHGDFCPWNMMDKNGQILLFDWEMGGSYPLGYDLFTYIFQTTFLLHPKKTIFSVLSKNKKIIDKYYSNFNISNWKKYLLAFSQIKVDLEKKKGPSEMLTNYTILLNYAKKA